MMLQKTESTKWRSIRGGVQLEGGAQIEVLRYSLKFKKTNH